METSGLDIDGRILDYSIWNFNKIMQLGDCQDLLKCQFKSNLSKIIISIGMGVCCNRTSSNQFLVKLKDHGWVNLLSDSKQKQLLKLFVDELPTAAYWDCSSTPVPLTKTYPQIGKTARYVPSQYCYFGEVKGQKPHGKGLIFYSNLFFYRGQFKEGLFDGEGRLFNNQFNKMRSGKWDCGEFEQGQIASRDGRILKIIKKEYKSIDYNSVQRYEIYYKDESIYHGSIKVIGNLILKDGQGKLNIPSSNYCYIGDWTMDKRHGRAVVKCAGQSTFQGQYQEDSRNKGILNIKNKLQYDGQWEQNGTIFTGKVKNLRTGNIFSIIKNNYVT